MPVTLEPSKPQAEIKLSEMPHKDPPAELPEEDSDAILRSAMEMAGAPMPEKEPAKVAPKEPTALVAKAPDKPATPPAKVEPPKKESPKELREAYERKSARVDELEQSHTATAKEKADAYAKLAEAEAKLTAAEKKINEEYEPRLAALTEKEKRLQQVEETLRIKAYQETPDFHDKYVKPIAEVQQEVKDLLGESLAIVDGQEVPATMQHFEYVASAASQTEAARRAEQVFGPHMAGTIANYRLRLKNLTKRHQEAASNAALESIEYEKRNQSAMAQAREGLMRQVSDMESKYVTEFRPPDDDAELQTALAEGKAFADEVMSATPAIGMDRFSNLIAKSRSKLQHEPVLVKKLARVTAELAEAKELLKAYHKSDPDIAPLNGSKRVVDDDSKESMDAILTEAALKLAHSNG